MNLFTDRMDAGRQLARELVRYKCRENAIVLALPRGGVPVAREVAEALSLPLDVWVVRKIGVPGHEELAMGAMAVGDVTYLNKQLIETLGISSGAIEKVISREAAELHRRNQAFRQERPPPDVKGKTAIVIDDGLATGATMRAAVESLRQAAAEKIIVAVPVAPEATCRTLEEQADEVTCLHMPEPFFGVGQWYADFSQTSDEEVQEALRGFQPA